MVVEWRQKKTLKNAKGKVSHDTESSDSTPGTENIKLAKYKLTSTKGGGGKRKKKIYVCNPNCQILLDLHTTNSICHLFIHLIQRSSHSISLGIIATHPQPFSAPPLNNPQTLSPWRYRKWTIPMIRHDHGGCIIRTKIGRNGPLSHKTPLAWLDDDWSRYTLAP